MLSELNQFFVQLLVLHVVIQFKIENSREQSLFTIRRKTRFLSSTAIAEESERGFKSLSFSQAIPNGSFAKIFRKKNAFIEDSRSVIEPTDLAIESG